MTNATVFDRGARSFPVIPLGFEPKTHSLEGCCSIQLSYGTRPLFAKGDCKYTYFPKKELQVDGHSSKDGDSRLGEAVHGHVAAIQEVLASDEEG